MSSKARFKQLAMKSALRIWELKSIDQLDPVVKLLIEVFCELVYENENSIEDIKERLLEQLAASLTPDSLIAARPAHSIMRAMPVEPEMEIDRQTVFYTGKLTSEAIKYGLKTISFAPATNHIKLVRGEIGYLLCERNLFRVSPNGDKDLFARASSFNQDLNRSVWIGFDLDKHIPSLKDIHFYFDFPNTPYKYELYDLLSHTKWSIGNQPLKMETGIAQPQTNEELSGGIFAHYNLLQVNDEEVMDLYRKQYLHITSSIRTATLEKSAFSTELIPFFPERVNDLEPQYWMKIEFPAFFKQEDFEDLTVWLNTFPVTNKNLNTHTLYANKSLTGILPLPMQAGEYFLAVESVEDSFGQPYKFLPYSISETPLGGTYTVKRGGLERFSTRDLKELIEQMVGLFRSELVTFTALKLDNINNSITDMERIILFIKDKVERNNSIIKSTPTYLLVDSDREKNDRDINAGFWTTNCDLANKMPYGTQFSPLKTIHLEKDSCYLLKSTSGAKAVPKRDEMLAAYKYALTTRDQLFSIRDIENFCRMKFSGKIENVKASLGIACGNKPKQGLIRTIDVTLAPNSESRELFNPVTLGELKLELEKRSPSTYNYRILLEGIPVS